MEPDKTNPVPEAAREGGKMPYRKPTLTEYGTLTKLTQGGGGNGSDINSTMVCL